MQDKIDGSGKLLQNSPLAAAIRAVRLHFSGVGGRKRIGAFAARAAFMAVVSTLATLGAVVSASYFVPMLFEAAPLSELFAALGCSIPAEVTFQAQKLAIDIGLAALQLGLVVAVTLSLAPITVPAARAARDKVQK